MANQIVIQGSKIKVDKDDYISLTDIVKNNSKQESYVVLVSWLRNNNTLLFLEEWEKTFNPNFNPRQMAGFKQSAMDNRSFISPKNYIKETGAIGIISKAGRYGGTFAHKDIALEFCSWFSPVFKVAMIKAFRVLIEEKAKDKNLEFHVSKITDNVEEIRNLLDTIPGQTPTRNRLNKTSK